MDNAQVKSLFKASDNHDVDTSEMLLTWYMYELQTTGSQKGEGFDDCFPADYDYAD